MVNFVSNSNYHYIYICHALFATEIFFMKRHELEEIITEELQSIVSDMLAEHFIMETLTAIQEQQKPTRTKYTSAGTVPRRQGRKMTPAQVQDRKTLGREILRAVKWGNAETNPVKKGFYRWAKKNDRPISSDTDPLLYSYVWAMASDYAIKGAELPAIITRAAQGPMSTRGAMNLKKGPDRKAVARRKEKKKATAAARVAKKIRLAPTKAAEKQMKKKIKGGGKKTTRRAAAAQRPQGDLGLTGTSRKNPAPVAKKAVKKTPSTAATDTPKVKKAPKKPSSVQTYLNLKKKSKPSKAPAPTKKSTPAKKKSSGGEKSQTDLFN